MSQHDYILDNASGLAFRGDLNDALEAIVSLNSGASEPTTTYAFMLWADTANNLLKIRNAANGAWVTVGTLSAANLGLLSLAGGTLTGALLVALGTVGAPGFAFSGDTNTGVYSSGADIMGLVAAGVEYLRVSSSGVDLMGTGAVKVPVGTTAQQPTPAAGMIRYNSTLAKFEGYQDGAWINIISGDTATVSSKTANYTLTSNDQLIIADSTSAAFTLTLPSAVGITGKKYFFKKINSSIANVVTIDPNGSETIDGYSTYGLYTEDEYLGIVSDGANWQVLEHKTETPWTDAGTITITAETSSPTKGTIDIDKHYWRRSGANIYIKYQYGQSATGGAAAGTGQYIFGLPVTVDTAIVPAVGAAIDSNIADSTNLKSSVGWGFISNSGDRGGIHCILRTSTSFCIAAQAEFTNGTTAVSSTYFSLNNSKIFYYMEIGPLPVSGWKP